MVDEGTKALATSKPAWRGWNSAALQSLMNERVQVRLTNGCQLHKKSSDIMYLLMEENNTTHGGVQPKSKNKKIKPDQASCSASSFIGNTGDRSSP